MAAFKKVVLMLAGTAMQRYGEKLQDEQEVLTYLADILIDTYAARERGAARAAAAARRHAATAALQADAARRLRARGGRPHRARRAPLPRGDGRRRRRCARSWPRCAGC